MTENTKESVHMPEKTDILSMLPEELEEFFLSIG